MPDGLRKPPKLVPLDADRLGHIAGAFAALLVAVTQMFMRDASLLTTLVRSGWVYVGVYAATFVLIRLFLRASLFQMLADKRSRRESRRLQLKDRQGTAKAEGAASAEAIAAPGQAGRGTLPPSESGLPSL